MERNLQAANGNCDRLRGRAHLCIGHPAQQDLRDGHAGEAWCRQSASQEAARASLTFRQNCVWTANNLIVVDAMNFRVQVLDKSGTFQYAIGKIATRPERCSAKGIAVDSEGDLYVVDGLWGAIQVFNRQGELLYYFGKRGTAAGQFQLPTGLFIDRTTDLCGGFAEPARAGLSLLGLPKPARGERSEKDIVDLRRHAAGQYDDARPAEAPETCWARRFDAKRDLAVKALSASCFTACAALGVGKHAAWNQQHGGADPQCLSMRSPRAWLRQSPV